MKLPNFFVAGVPKAGSTSLHHYLRQHPQVYMNPIKEPLFFATADLRAREGFFPTPTRDRTRLREYLAGPQQEPAQFWVTEWEDYVAFRHVRDELAVGEASVTYVWTPNAAPAIRSALPGARLIFMLRDPADRLFSWYLLTLRRDPRFRLTFRDWLGQMMNGGADYGATVDAGRFATHLYRFLDHFPRDQMRIYLYEDFRADTRAVLRDMFQFLDVDPDYPVDVSRRYNETMMPRLPRLHRLRGRIVGNASLTSWLPAPARGALRRLYYRPRGRLRMSPGDRGMLIDFYREDILRTAELLDRDLSAWLR